VYISNQVSFTFSFRRPVKMALLSFVKQFHVVDIGGGPTSGKRHISSLLSYAVILTLLAAMFPSCLPVVPAVGGASNIKRGQVDPYVSGGLNFSMYNLWDSMFVGGRNTFGVVAPGLRYGLVDAVNVGLQAWTSISDIGVSPSLHFQLLGGVRRLNLCLRGSVSKFIFAGDKRVEYWAMPELIFGPTENLYFGFRYEYRSVNTHFNKTYNHPAYDSTWGVPLLCAFFGTEYGEKFQWATPYALVHYDMSLKVWQVSFGTTCHFLRGKK
jgi:hypothetical protein